LQLLVQEQQGREEQLQQRFKQLCQQRDDVKEQWAEVQHQEQQQQQLQIQKQQEQQEQEQQQVGDGGSLAQPETLQQISVAG